MCALQYLRLLPSGSKWGLVYVILTLGMVNNAGASWLDSDYWCRVYGCIAVGDGNAWDIYDVYDFSTGRTVRAGQPLIAWSGNPYQGSGTVNAVKTGTLNPVDTPNTYQGVLIDIDQNGDSLADGLLSDANASGYLDLGDGLAEFGLTPQTDIVLKDRAFKHSFYIAARTDFYVYGRAWLQSGSGELADSISPEQTGLGVDMVRTGVDNGFAFGSSTTDPDFVPASGIADLDDIWNTPKRLAEFRRNGGTRASNSNDVANQAVRVDIEYQLPEPDFSYGTGELAYRVEYLFYNR
ncbi:MAG: hypothetical protein KDJ38_16360 [Gammaproteobacteria bacterium]|nr:hypothetical protein [Gammaproteobacteria bacterium]